MKAGNEEFHPSKQVVLHATRSRRGLNGLAHAMILLHRRPEAPVDEVQPLLSASVGRPRPAEHDAGQEAVVRTAREAFPIVEAAHDQPTADLLTQRMQIHEKTAWMLRSLLEAK